MKKCSSVNLDMLIDDSTQLEEKMTELKGRNSMLEIRLDETNRGLKFALTKEKCLTEERDMLVGIVKRLQQTLQQQCDLRVENEKLKGSVAELRKQNESTAEEREAEVSRLQTELSDVADRHQRALEAIRQQCCREVDEAHTQTLSKLEAKDAEVREHLDRKEADLEEMRSRLRDQERERQSEILKLQMEFGAKLARVQSTSQRSQEQPQSFGLLSQNIFKRKLQFVQEEKSREVEALRQRIRELEQHVTDSHERLKRRKI